MVKKEKKEEVEPAKNDPDYVYYQGTPVVKRTVTFDVDNRVNNAMNFLKNTMGLWNEQDLIRTAIARLFTDQSQTIFDREYKQEQIRKLSLDNEEKRRRLYNDDGTLKHDNK